MNGKLRSFSLVLSIHSDTGDSNDAHLIRVPPRHFSATRPRKSSLCISTGASSSFLKLVALKLLGVKSFVVADRTEQFLYVDSNGSDSMITFILDLEGL